MFKILKIIFFGIKDIIRIKKINNKKYTAKERIEMCESCEDFKPKQDNVEYVGVLWILKQK